MDTAVQTFEPTPEPSPRPSANAPQLRTLLLTDLVDSTGLVERLGDAPASDLFRAHDHLVLKLQQQWRGRLIDRSDGMLLLFERPIDGLGFALDYTRGLIALGDERGIELRARIGLHVGEVLTWRNSEEAVSVGAKPVEVEGLAKPMAARLMATARPGQILLSSVAEPLAHRAARELGERGLHLAWKSWGRWRFKGVPESQQIFEVGEPGIAPLRMPPDTPKAWRDIPLWRRPAALAAEAALLAGLALGAWFIARPEPAIAFNQRDWVVIGDLRNLTGQATLDDSLEQAFRISLEQSRHVNVLSDLKARDTLTRMQRAPDTKLDRTIASEIALRDGARAVILPTVAEIGGRVRVSAEVIDPRTQTTVYTETAEGTGVASTLDSIDEVTASLRGKLGEAVKSIEKDSKPLPQVTTKNLDALRAYALGQREYARGQFSEAAQLFQRATSLDPGFALAWLGQLRSSVSAVDAGSGLPALERAKALRDRMPPREALYLDAWVAEIEDTTQALPRWQEMAKLYPDFWPALGNAAIRLNSQNRYAEAVGYAKANSAAQNELRSLGFDEAGRAYLGLQEYKQAASAFDRAIVEGAKGSVRRRAAVDAAVRNLPEARRRLDGIPKDDPYAFFEKVSVELDAGAWRVADAKASEALMLAKSQGGFTARVFLVPQAVAKWYAGHPSDSLRYAHEAADEALGSLRESNDAYAEQDVGLALASALVGLRLGDRALAAKVLAFVGRNEHLLSLPQVPQLAAIVRAEDARIAGRVEEAVEILENQKGDAGLYQLHMALLEAYEAAGKTEEALEQAHWLRTNRGIAYIESSFGQCLQTLNVADSNASLLREALLLDRQGKRSDALKLLAKFDRLWPAATLPSHLSEKRSSLLDASS